MLTIERVKELLNAPGLSDQEAMEARDHVRALVEIIFAKHRLERAGEHQGSADRGQESPHT